MPSTSPNRDSIVSGLDLVGLIAATVAAKSKPRNTPVFNLRSTLIDFRPDVTIFPWSHRFTARSADSRLYRLELGLSISPRCRLERADMARPKEFDPERALAKAMNLFWRRGYENTSLETLMKEMGIAKQSLYDTFGDKRALYLKAMAHYRDQTNSQMQKMLNEIPSVREGFARLLYGRDAETRAP